MSDELFPAEQVAMDSPKIAWLKKHNLETEYFASNDDEPECWACRVINPSPNFNVWYKREIGFGVTEEEACASLANRAGLKLWNEEES